MRQSDAVAVLSGVAMLEPSFSRQFDVGHKAAHYFFGRYRSVGFQRCSSVAARQFGMALEAQRHGFLRRHAVPVRSMFKCRQAWPSVFECAEEFVVAAKPEVHIRCHRATNVGTGCCDGGEEVNRAAAGCSDQDLGACSQRQCIVKKHRHHGPSYAFDLGAWV